MIIVAISHLKGGVGKSTTTMFLAEHWALQGDRVLVIDLDPQSNSSYMLLSREGLLQWESARRTLPDLFRDVREGMVRDYADYVVPRASDLQELLGQSASGYVSLLPSVPRLWFEEYEFDKVCYKQDRDPVAERARVIKEFCMSAAGAYDFVLLDCPPGFGTLTRAGLKCADAILTPTIADYVSTRSLADFFEYGLVRGLKIDPREHVHLAISKYTSNGFQRDVLDLLRASYSVVDPPIGFRKAVLDATEHLAGRIRTYGQKYPSPLATEMRALSEAAKARILGAHSNRGRNR